jgi:hypothetical protein
MKPLNSYSPTTYKHFPVSFGFHLVHPFIRRRKKEKKKSSSKPAAEGEEQEDVEICLGSGKDDFLNPLHYDSVCIVKN